MRSLVASRAEFGFFNTCVISKQMGAKTFSLADSKTGYTYNWKLYTGMYQVILG